MKVIITGATGLVGTEVVRQAILDESVESIILLVRNPSSLQDPKITALHHKNFSDYSGLETYFSDAGAIIWCLGTSQLQVSKQQYEVITCDYLLRCVQFCEQLNPGISFVFVSGDGADRTEKSRTLFKRLKGKAENILLQSGLTNVFIARPDAVNPRHKNPKAPLAYKLVYPLFPLIEFFAPGNIIWSDVLARALLRLAKKEQAAQTFENRELRELGK